MYPDYAGVIFMKNGLNRNALKLIAIAAMTIDHLTWILIPGYDLRWWVLALHALGRITAPIMWFFLSEGFHYTHDRKKYALRLLILAIISHFAYNFCFGIPFLPFANGNPFDQTGVIWALFLGLCALWMFDAQPIPKWAQTVAFLGILVLAFPANWSCIAVMAVCVIHDNRGNFKKQMAMMVLCVGWYAAVYCIFLNVPYGLLQMAVVLSIPLLARYNGEKGKSKAVGRLFYWYYPAHLAILGVLRVILHGNISIR